MHLRETTYIQSISKISFMNSNIREKVKGNGAPVIVSWRATSMSFNGFDDSVISAVGNEFGSESPNNDLLSKVVR